jgi:O-acetyl-ADP-ribose deacetylase (regulator of RNase III)
MSEFEEEAQAESRAGARSGEFEELTAELRLLRKSGLVELRRLRLRALGDNPAHIESSLRAAVAAMGPGTLAEAAAYTFGLAQGTRDWPAQDRRKRAAEVYGVSIERFRKQQERIVVEQVAEQLLALGADRVEPDRAEREAGPGTGPQAPETHLGIGPPTHVQPTGVAPSASPAADGPVPGGRGAAGGLRIGDEFVLEYPVAKDSAGRAARVTVHVLPIELVRNVDVLVGTSNVYFEVSRIFSNTVSASLRRAAARSDAAGRITDDVVQRELAAWVAARGGAGTAVPPGTVAATQPGSLAEQGVRRLYHAAIAIPTGSDEHYFVDASAVTRAVRGVFAVAARERDAFDPPLSSVCLPLFGAGRGGLELDQAISILWLAVAETLCRNPHWSVHFAVRRPEAAQRLMDYLTTRGTSSPQSRS